MKTKDTSLNTIIVAILILAFSSFTEGQVILYGLTSSGGTSNMGTVFSITPTGNLNVISNLNSIYAAMPNGSLLYASDGKFYASSLEGGYNDSCTIFSCTANGTLATVINLDSVWGSSMPLGNSLIQGMDGNLYGMTYQGGPIKDSMFIENGVIFKLQLSGQYTALHFFNDTDGAKPAGSLIQTADGNLWGMTTSGGAYGSGTIFHCTTSGTFTSVFSFSISDGTNPYGDLFLANDGNFYGMTSTGGAHNFGTLFRYTPLGTFTKLFDFNDTNGAYPYGSLIQANDGNLYGLTSYGGTVYGGTHYDSVYHDTVNGAMSYGTLFKCTLSGTLTTLVSFNDTNGADPFGTLIQASDGNLYGMTYQGGLADSGTAFKYPLSGTLSTVYKFGAYSGYTPMYGKLIEVDHLLSIDELTNANAVKIYPNPNTGFFNVQLSPNNNKSSIEVYDLLGQQVYQAPLNKATTQLDLANNASGI
ncbi:MAG TPA: choice-of-anchor tandem repeat GloVer-containing protein, partial [Bacteroidia bacterium]|nr:choice-of-anchor tandem repeat GloVer-containing protein [Bacteroidia bacterium]